MNERGVSIRQESIFDRIAALKDIVPPSTRRSIAHSFRTFSQYTFFSGRLFGNVVWVVTTSALLVGLPLMLAIEDEHRVVAQEKELMAQQQGAQHVS